MQVTYSPQMKKTKIFITFICHPPLPMTVRPHVLGLLVGNSVWEVEHADFVLQYL